MQLSSCTSPIQLSIADVKTDYTLLSNTLRNNGDVFNQKKIPIFLNDFLYVGNMESIDPDEIISISYLQLDRLSGAEKGNGIIAIYTKSKAV